MFVPGMMYSASSGAIEFSNGLFEKFRVRLGLSRNPAGDPCTHPAASVSLLSLFDDDGKKRVLQAHAQFIHDKAVEVVQVRSMSNGASPIELLLITKAIRDGSQWPIWFAAMCIPMDSSDDTE